MVLGSVKIHTARLQGECNHAIIIIDQVLLHFKSCFCVCVCACMCVSPFSCVLLKLMNKRACEMRKNTLRSTVCI